MHDIPCVPTFGVEPRGRHLISACANLQKVVGSGLHAYVEAYLAEPERLPAKKDKRGYYKPLKSTVGAVGGNARSEQDFITDEDGALLQDKVRERWAGFWTQSLQHEVAETRSHDHRPLATATT